MNVKEYDKLFNLFISAKHLEWNWLHSYVYAVENKNELTHYLLMNETEN